MNTMTMPYHDRHNLKWIQPWLRLWALLKYFDSAQLIFSVYYMMNKIDWVYVERIVL